MSKTFLFFSAQYLPTTGGVERYTNCLARTLIGMGHRVLVATSALDGLSSHEFDPDGIEIFRFPAVPFMGGRLPLVRFGKKFRDLEQMLWAQNIDFCVINTYFYPLSMYAASQIHRRCIPAILINHGSAWLMTGSPLLQFAGQVYENIAARLCRHYCKRFFGVSTAAADWVHTFGISAEGTVTNAIDPLDTARSIAQDLNWRASLGLPEDAKIIAFVGRMIPEKGVDPMIHAMAAIRRSVPDACLLMAGSGPLLDAYQNTAPDGVFLLGNQEHRAVMALLAQADVFCLPTRSEGFACTVLEAAAVNCPVITTATGGSTQLLLDQRHGILLENMEPDSIAKACIYALEHPQWRKEAAHLAKQQLLEHYTWDKAAAQLLDAFSVPHP